MIPKFRAWLREDKSMNNVECMNFDFEHVFLSGWRESFNIKDIDLMQSTGLKDKNGVEIFEGDLVQAERGEIGYIAYLLQEAGFVVVLKNSDYRLGHRNTGEPYDTAVGHEVIGNIYENPELLEEIK